MYVQAGKPNTTKTEWKVLSRRAQFGVLGYRVVVVVVVGIEFYTLCYIHIFIARKAK